MRSRRPPTRPKPAAARSTTGGAKSSLPANHGFTVCWSPDRTSVRWLACSERRWLATDSANTPTTRPSARPQLRPSSRPSTTAAASIAARRIGARHGARLLGAAVGSSPIAIAMRAASPAGASWRGSALRRAVFQDRAPASRRAHRQHSRRCASISSRCERSNSPSTAAAIRGRTASHSMGWLLVARPGGARSHQIVLQLPAGACQSRHDGAQRNACDLGDLAVRQSFELVQNEHLAELRRQALDTRAQLCEVVFLPLELSEFGGRVVDAVYLVVEGSGRFGSAGPSQLRVADVANDRQQPAAAVATTEARQRAVCSHARLLHGVLGVVVVPEQPTREVEGAVEVRQHELLERRRCRQRRLHCLLHAGGTALIPTEYARSFHGVRGMVWITAACSSGRLATGL